PLPLPPPRRFLFVAQNGSVHGYDTLALADFLLSNLFHPADPVTREVYNDVVLRRLDRAVEGAEARGEEGGEEGGRRSVLEAVREERRTRRQERERMDETTRDLGLGLGLGPGGEGVVFSVFHASPSRVATLIEVVDRLVEE